MFHVVNYPVKYIKIKSATKFRLGFLGFELLCKLHQIWLSTSKNIWIISFFTIYSRQSLQNIVQVIPNFLTTTVSLVTFDFSANDCFYQFNFKISIGYSGQLLWTSHFNNVASISYKKTCYFSSLKMINFWVIYSSQYERWTNLTRSQNFKPKLNSTFHFYQL